MAKRKLTPKLKEHLYNNRWKVKQSDYTGEALAYLLRLRAASKAAKKRKDNKAQIGKAVIPKNSEMYKLIQESAKMKKQTVSKFIKENEQAILKLMKDGNVIINRETSYAVKDINRLPKGSKIFINGDKVSKGEAIYRLQNVTSVATMNTSTVVINYEMKYDLLGNLYLELPTEEELQEAEEDIESGEDNTMDELLNNAGGLTVIRSSKKK